MKNNKEKNKDSDFVKRHRTEWTGFLWKRVLDRLPDLKSAQQKRIFNSLFSEYEKRVIAMRIAMLSLIKHGKGNREISRLIWVSKDSVTTLRKNFFGNKGMYKSKRYLPTKRRSKTEITTLAKSKKHWIDEIFKDIDVWEIIKNPPRPPGMGLKN